MTEELLPLISSNPFIANDGAAYAVLNPALPKQRQRITQDTFWKIYNSAGEQGLYFLQIAMAISLLTTLRRGDICELNFNEHIIGNNLKKVVNKSSAKLGEVAASKLEWDLSEHPLLRQAINRARELSLKNSACPYVLSHSYTRRNKSKNKTHIAQVLPEYLSKTFKAVRDSLGLDASQATVSFHEVRSLSSYLLGLNYGIDKVSEVMAHTSEEMTRHYMQGHDLKFNHIGIQLSADNLKQSF